MELWTAAQRRGLVVVTGAVLLLLAIQLARYRQTVPDIAPLQGPSSQNLADRIDPNTATEPELAAIPTLGEKRAQAIVDYRRAFAPGAFPIFRQPIDLQGIRGIGSATAEAMAPYLIFPSDSTTRP